MSKESHDKRMASEKFDRTDLSIWQERTSTHKFLLDAVKKNASSFTIIQRKVLGPCILVVSPIISKATCTFTQVVERLDESLRNELDRCVDFIFEHTLKDGPLSNTFLAVLGPLPQKHLNFKLLSDNDGRQWGSEYSRTSDELSDSFSLAQRRSQKFTFLKLPFGGVGSRMLGLCVFMAIFLLGIMTIFFQHSQRDEIQIQYDVGNSIGPKYTSLLTPDNITAWAEKHYNPQDWYIRIDDQALIPIELMDEQEWRYQEYLSKRYPEKAEFRDSGAWRDLNFLSEPNNYMLPSDMEFHTGHCIRAIRRYWQAKETGRHVCPWDVDYLHLRHCFSMLESVMLPPGPRDDSSVVGMSWRTKVCMWEP